MIAVSEPHAVAVMPPVPTYRIPRLRYGTTIYLESELRDYQVTKREITQFERDVCESNMGIDYNERVGSGGSIAGHSDPTGARGTRLAAYKLLTEMRRVCEAIEGVIDLLPQEQKQALALLYWKRAEYGTTKRVAEVLHVDERTVRRWRGLWLALIAERLGKR